MAAPAARLGSAAPEQRSLLVLLISTDHLSVLLLTLAGLWLYQLPFKPELSDWHVRRQLNLRCQPGLGRQQLLAEALVWGAASTEGAWRTAPVGKGGQGIKTFVWWPVWGHSGVWTASLESGHNLCFCGQSGGNAAGKGEILKKLISKQTNKPTRMTEG